jgi:hypothetical protein
MPLLADLFCGCRWFILGGLLDLRRGFFRFWGLTFEFAVVFEDRQRKAWFHRGFGAESNRSVASSFGLRSGLRQSGSRFATAFLRHA